MRHRPVGLGVMGFQDALYQLRLPYASDAAVQFADCSMESVCYHAYWASTQLAEERGRYSSYRGSLWDRLGELRMPVLLMAGEHDTAYCAAAFRMAAAIGERSEVSIVPGAGHAAHLERAEAFATLLSRFLSRVAA